MAKKTDAYLDTGALIAFLDRSDSHHARFVQLFSAPPRLLTSDLVIAEGHGWFLKRYDGTRALQFVQFIEALPVLQIVPADVKILKAAYAVLRKFSDQPLTLADAVGLTLMQHHRLHHCWSTDRHLTLMGAALAIHV